MIDLLTLWRGEALVEFIRLANQQHPAMREQLLIADDVRELFVAKYMLDKAEEGGSCDVA